MFLALETGSSGAKLQSRQGPPCWTLGWMLLGQILGDLELGGSQGGDKLGLVEWGFVALLASQLCLISSSCSLLQSLD